MARRKAKKNRLSRCDDWDRVLDLLPLCSPLRQSKEFKAKWIEWAEWRRNEKKNPLTETSVRRQVAKLDGFASVPKAIASIDYSLDVGYQGLFEPRGFKDATEKDEALLEEGRRQAREQQCR